MTLMISGFPHSIGIYRVDGKYLNDDTFEDVTRWLRESIGEYRVTTPARGSAFGDIAPRIVHFRSDADAMTFKMRWADDLKKSEMTITKTFVNAQSRQLSAKWSMLAPSEAQEIKTEAPDLLAEIQNELIAEINKATIATILASKND